MKIGAITIGQSPRVDVIPDIQEVLGSEVEIIEKGALDGLSLKDVQNFYPESSDYTLVTKMQDGTEVKIAKKHIVPRMKNCLVELEKKGADIIMLLCTGEFQEMESKKIILRPDRILQNLVKGILEKGQLGVIVPSPEQIPAAVKRWSFPNVDVVPEAVSPYTGTESGIIDKAKKIKNFNVDLIVLDCMGFNLKTKSIFTGVTRTPVLLPSTLLGIIAREIFSV